MEAIPSIPGRLPEGDAFLWWPWGIFPGDVIDINKPVFILRSGAWAARKRRARSAGNDYQGIRIKLAGPDFGVARILRITFCVSVVDSGSDSYRKTRF